MPNFTLPDDFSNFTQAPDVEWKSLEQQGGEARARSVDLIGKLWMEEEAQGKAGWRARVQMRLGLDEASGGEGSKALNTIGDYARIFRTFRLAGEDGLGWSLSDISQHQPGRLRVFSNNRDWTLRNPDTVRQMLDSGRNEARLRQEITAAVDAERVARGEAPTESKKKEWVNFTLRLSPEDEALLITVLDGVLARSEEQGEKISDGAATAYGDAVMRIAGEWFNGQTVVIRDSVPQHVDNAEWVARAANEKMDTEAQMPPRRAGEPDIAVDDDEDEDAPF